MPRRGIIRPALWFTTMGVAVGLFGAVTGGCARQTDPNAPPSVRYGEDLCAACGMIISDPAHAAAYRTSGEVRRFDDLGEMVVYQREKGETAVVAFVHDYRNRDWLRAEQAYFVSSPSLRTPMGYGVVALSSEAEARALAEQVNGRLWRFGELVASPDLSSGKQRTAH